MASALINTTISRHRENAWRAQNSSRRLAPRAMVGPIPVVSLMALQVIVVGALALWGRDVRVLWWAVPLGLVLLSIVLFRRDEPLALTGLRRVEFAASDRVRHGTEPGLGLLPSLFPDLQVRRGHNRLGHGFGVATHGSLAVCAVQIRHTSAGTLHRGQPIRVPVERIIRRVTTTGIPLHSLAVITTASGGSPGAPSPALEAVLGGLGDHAAGLGRSTTVVAIRLDVVRAGQAIEARGGGHRGLVSALATVTNLVEAELRAEGLGANALEPQELVGQIRESLFEWREDGVWEENWDHVSSGSVFHRTLILDRWHSGSSLDALLTLPGPGSVAALEVFPDLSVGTHQLVTRTWLRHTDPHLTEVRRTSVRTSASRASGLRFTPLNGQQLAGVRSTTILGGDHATAS